jgi:dihydroflavonol-4-reductase
VNLLDFPGEIVEADLRDEGAVREAMRGGAELYHVAADYRLWARDPGEILRNNEVMTRAVMRAALAEGGAGGLHLVRGDLEAAGQWRGR